MTTIHTTTGAEFLNRALELIDSESTRAWVNTAHNRPIFERIAASAIERSSDGDPDPNRLAAYIVCLKIGA